MGEREDAEFGGGDAELGSLLRVQGSFGGGGQGADSIQGVNACLSLCVSLLCSPRCLQVTAITMRGFTVCESVLPLLRVPVVCACPDDQLVEAAKKLTGDIEQVPPMYSALHHNVSDLLRYTLQDALYCARSVAFKSHQRGALVIKRCSVACLLCRVIAIASLPGPSSQWCYVLCVGHGAF